MATPVLALEGISQEERARRRTSVRRAIRLNQSEGLQPTARHLALDERYISGEITFEEYTRIVLSW
jgi:uncharacterized membrane protein